MESIITLQEVKKALNGHSALDRINFTVRKNEIVSIIGPSGAGKTTLLRTIAGLEPTDSGEVIVNGTIGMVFQHCFLWPHKTVLENVAEPLIKVKRIDRRGSEEKAREILAKFNLSYRIDVFPDMLSGGELQRVAIARTLIMEPEILLLDEITSALDPLLIKDVLEVLRKLAQEKRTLIIVTHEMAFAKDVSDRVVFLDEGRIVEEGHPYKIFMNPENEKTRLFVNSIK